ncbi:MAG TPA: hypothetical protein VGM56_33585 [Byssovorax sp.]
MSAYEEVPYPPPAARAEVVPPKPDGAVVWLDGQWDWSGSSWRWTHGGWVVAPTDARYQPWLTARRNDGRLYFARATWRDGRGQALQAAPTFVAAAGAADHGPPSKARPATRPAAPATTASAIAVTAKAR